MWYQPRDIWKCVSPRIGRIPHHSIWHAVSFPVSNNNDRPFCRKRNYFCLCRQRYWTSVQRIDTILFPSAAVGSQLFAEVIPQKVILVAKICSHDRYVWCQMVVCLFAGWLRKIFFSSNYIFLNYKQVRLFKALRRCLCRWRRWILWTTTSVVRMANALRYLWVCSCTWIVLIYVHVTIRSETWCVGTPRGMYYFDTRMRGVFHDNKTLCTTRS